MIKPLSIEEAKKRGEPLGISDYASLYAFRMMLNDPPVAQVLQQLLDTLMFKNTLDPRLRELVILRTAWRTKSEYEFMRHTVVCRKLKISEQEQLGVRDPQKCPSFSDVDRAVLKMADELSDHADMSDETRAILERNFKAEEILELIFSAGAWRMFAAFFNSIKIPLDPDVAGGWPEGRKP